MTSTRSKMIFQLSGHDNDHSDIGNQYHNHPYNEWHSVTLDKHGIGRKLIEFAKWSKIPVAFRDVAAVLYINHITCDHSNIHIYSFLRFELIEIMRASGMNTQSATGPAGREIQRSQHLFFLANFFGRKSLWLVATNIYWGWYLSPRTADQASSDTTGKAASKRETQPLLFWVSPLPTSQTGCNPLLSKNVKYQASTLWQLAESKEKYTSVLADQMSPGDH